MSQQLTAEQKIQNANIVRDLLTHPGMKLLTDKLNKKLDLKRHEWLQATTPEQAEQIRQDGRVYAALMGILNEFLIHGEQAIRMKSTEDVSDDQSSKGK